MAAIRGMEIRNTRLLIYNRTPVPVSAVQITDYTFPPTPLNFSIKATIF